MDEMTIGGQTPQDPAQPVQPQPGMPQPGQPVPPQPAAPQPEQAPEAPAA